MVCNEIGRENENVLEKRKWEPNKYVSKHTTKFGKVER